MTRFELEVVAVCVQSEVSELSEGLCSKVLVYQGFSVRYLRPLFRV